VTVTMLLKVSPASGMAACAASDGLTDFDRLPNRARAGRVSHAMSLIRRAAIEGLLPASMRRQVAAVWPEWAADRVESDHL